MMEDTIIIVNNTGLAMLERVFGHLRTASAQSDKGLHCPLTELLDTIECTKKEMSR